MQNHAACRHNFSVYFYHMYLTYGDESASGNTEPPLPDITLPEGAPEQLQVLLYNIQLAVQKLTQPALLAFAPQLIIMLAFAWRLHQELPLCWLVQIMAFVALNKVSFYALGVLFLLSAIIIWCCYSCAWCKPSFLQRIYPAAGNTVHPSRPLSTDTSPHPAH